MTNKQRRSIVNEAKSKGYTGSYVDLFKQVALNPSDNQEVLTADTPQEKEQGLRPLHEAGRTDASMEFKDVPPNTPFNTMGMKAPIDIKKFDEQGHLVKSYENVPPGIQNLGTGPRRGTVLETPSRMQEGGVKDNTRVSMPELQDQEAFNPYSDLHLPPSGRIDYSGANVEDLLGIGALLKAPVKAAAKNAYKINPFATKLNDPNAFFRIAGRDALRDAQERGLISAKPLPKNATFDQRYFIPDFPSFAKGKPDLRYLKKSDDVIFKNTREMFKRNEINPVTGKKIRGTHWAYRAIDPKTGRNFREIPLEEVYEATPHWLKGFKPIKKQTGGYNPNEYMNEMEPKVFPNQKRDAQWVNYATQHDFAGRFPGETRTNEQIGLERSNRNTVPLVPNPVRAKELKRPQEGGFENRKKAQQGTVVDYLLPALESNNALDFGNQQAESQAKLVAKSEQDLDAERQHVQGVRANVIPTAKNIASRWENMSSEDKAAYDDILDYATNSSATGLAPPTRGKTRGQQTSEVRQKLADRPESLKEYMPNYNIFLDQPDKFGTNRGVYCTTMGCFAYEEAGARQITDANGHPMRGNAQFVRATQQGVSGFEQVNPEDRQPGDLTVLRGSAAADYNNPSNRVTRDHHTVIYAGESEREESARSIGRRALDWFTGEGEEKNPEYSKSNPGAIKAYSAEGGDMHQFSLATRNNENPSTGEGFKFYRYVGQTPQMTGRVEEAKQRQVKADMVAKALQQNAEAKSKLGPERPEAPNIELIGSKKVSPIETEDPKKDIVKTNRKTTESKPKLAEKIANRAKGKAYELKDRRKSKQPKEPKAASEKSQRKAKIKAIKKQTKDRIKEAKQG